MSIDVAIKYATEANALNASARSVTKIADELERVARNEKNLTVSKLKAFGAEFGKTSQNATSANRAMGFMGGMAPGSFGMLTMGAVGAGMAVGAVVSKVFDLASALGEMGAKAAVAFGEFAVQSGMFREDTLTSLGVLLKSKEVAKSVYDSAVNFAAVTPFNTTEVVTGYKQLLAVGFKVEELKSVFTSLGDFAAGSGIQNALPRAVMVFGQIRAAGRLLSQDMNQLSSLGLDRTAVYAAIGKTMGKSAEEARKLAQDGKVDAETALKAIMSVMNTNFGGMMGEKAKLLSGLWSTLISKPFELMNKAFEVDGGGLNAFYDSVKSGVKGVIDLLYEGENLTDFGQSTVKAINEIGHAFQQSIGVGRQFFEGFFDGLSKSHGGVNEFRDSMGNLDLTKIGEEARKFGGDVATIADATAKVSSAFLKLSESESVAWTIGAAFSFIGAAVSQTVVLAQLLSYPFIQTADAVDWLIGKVNELTGAMSSLSAGGGGLWSMPELPSAAGIPNIDIRTDAMSNALRGGDTRVLPSVSSDSSSSSPSRADGAAGNSTVNNNNVSVAVSGGMMPAEIAALCRREIDRALEAL